MDKTLEALAFWLWQGGEIAHTKLGTLGSYHMS